jgi:chromate transporter
MPEAVWLLYGIKPVIIAVIVRALWGLGKAAVNDFPPASATIAVVILFFLGANEILLLFAAGFAVMAFKNLHQIWKAGRVAGFGFPVVSTLFAAGTTDVPVVVGTPVTLAGLTLFFLKIGSILFGSGYVLLAFLRADLVERWHWLTDQQLLDAVAIGQFTPGPVFTTATFIGYLIAGSAGAVLATIGIFLPAFVFVAASSPLIPRIRRSPWAGGFLDGVNAASLGLMAVVTWQLGSSALIDVFTFALAVVSALLVFRLKINSVWLVLAGGIAGFVYKLWL